MRLVSNCFHLYRMFNILRGCFFGHGAHIQELRAKGYDTYIILQWLREELSGGSDARFDTVSSLVWLADTWVAMMCDGEDWLSEDSAHQIKIVGETFFKVYLQAAHMQPQVWKIRPKWHVAHHLVLEAAMRPSHRNPSKDSTWMDEDWMRKVARVIKRTHKKTSPLTTLQRYLMFLKQKFRMYSDETAARGG